MEETARLGVMFDDVTSEELIILAQYYGKSVQELLVDAVDVMFKSYLGDDLEEFTKEYYDR